MRNLTYCENTLSKIKYSAHLYPLNDLKSNAQLSDLQGYVYVGPLQVTND